MDMSQRHKTYKNFMTNKFRVWAPKAFDWTLDAIKYTFFSSAYYFIEPKNIKIGNISFESEKGAKNSYGSYPTEFVFEVKNEN
jgi:hypothetical protein